jgi:hypothetical protein
MVLKYMLKKTIIFTARKNDRDEMVAIKKGIVPTYVLHKAVGIGIGLEV